MASTIFGLFMNTNEVKAENYTGQAIWPSEYISNIYIKKIDQMDIQNINKLGLLEEVKIISLYIAYNHLLILIIIMFIKLLEVIMKHI